MSNRISFYPIDTTTFQALFSFDFQNSTPNGLDFAISQTSKIPQMWTIAIGKKRKNNLTHTPEP